MNLNIKDKLKVELESKLNAEELYVIALALQKLKRMSTTEIDKELEYFSVIMDESKIKEIADNLQDDMYCTLRNLQLK